MTQEETKKRTPLEQLARLEARGCGHCREANDIRESLKTKTADVKTATAEPSVPKPKTKAKDRRRAA